MIKHSRQTKFRWRLGEKVSRLAARVLGSYVQDSEFNCGFACAFVEPYGFVPEDGCPIHDRTTTNLKIVIQKGEFR